MSDHDQRMGTARRVAADYVAHLRARQVRPGSVVAIRNEVTRWVMFTRGQPFRATPRSIERYLGGRQLSASSHNSALSHLRGFYRWAIRDGLTTRDPTLLVDRVRVPRRERGRPIGDDDLAVALDLADLELRAMLLLGALGGLRCCEIAELQWADLTPSHMLVRGKGGHERRIPVHSEVARAVFDLERTDRYVFAMRARHRANRISQRLNRFLHDCGITATAHQLRHWYGTKTYDRSKDLRVVSELMGHSSSATTTIYVRASEHAAFATVNGLRLPTWQPALQL